MALGQCWGSANEISETVLLYLKFDKGKIISLHIYFYEPSLDNYKVIQFKNNK